MSIVKNQTIQTTVPTINRIANKNSINQLPGKLCKEILGYIKPKETATTLQLVQQSWKHTLCVDGCLNLSGMNIADADLEQIIKAHQKMGKITSINLSHCYISDKGLKHLAHLPLTQLNIKDCPNITDAGLRHLANLPLKQLDLSDCLNITDEGLKHLTHLPLKQLELSRCYKITDEGLKRLTSLPLTQLNLLYCPNITNEGIKHLAHLPLTQLDLSFCNKITNEGLKHLAYLPLTQLNLSFCNKITDEDLKQLARLPLTQLDLSRCEGITTKGLECISHIPFKMTDLNNKRLKEESAALEAFVMEKSKKFGVQCNCQFKSDEHEMSTDVTGTSFKINVNSLFKLGEENLRSFLLKKPELNESIKAFLAQKKPELLDQISIELIQWYKSELSEPMTISENTKFIAKEILIMNAIGKLPAVKRFLLTHEMGHAHDHNGTKSLGDFDAQELDFIKSHQYGEVRADLTAAREENAHELGITFFEWHSILANHPDGLGVHPTDENRVKALQIDKAKKLVTTTPMLIVLQECHKGVGIDGVGILQRISKTDALTLFFTPERQKISVRTVLLQAANQFCDENPGIDRNEFLMEINAYADTEEM